MTLSEVPSTGTLSASDFYLGFLVWWWSDIGDVILRYF